MQGWESEWGGWVGGIPSIFSKKSIPYSRFARSDETDLKDFPERLHSKVLILAILRFPKINICQNQLGIPCIFEVFLQSQSQKHGFLRVGGISNNPKNHEHLSLGYFYPSTWDLTSAR